MLKYKKFIFKFDYELCIIKFKKNTILRKYYHTSSPHHHVHTEHWAQLRKCNADTKKSLQNINHLKETRVLCWSIFLLVYGAIHWNVCPLFIKRLRILGCTLTKCFPEYFHPHGWLGRGCGRSAVGLAGQVGSAVEVLVGCWGGAQDLFTQHLGL